MKKLQRRFAPTPAAFERNQWPVCSGITGRFERNTQREQVPGTSDEIGTLKSAVVLISFLVPIITYAALNCFDLILA